MIYLALIPVAAVAIFCIYLIVQSFKGKNQIIKEKCEQIDELKVIRDVFVEESKKLRHELEEEQIRTKAITELYDEKCEQYDELHAITVTNIFKPKDKKFLTLQVSTKALEDEIGKTMNLLGKVINA